MSSFSSFPWPFLILAILHKLEVMGVALNGKDDIRMLRSALMIGVVGVLSLAKAPRDWQPRIHDIGKKLGIVRTHQLATCRSFLCFDGFALQFTSRRRRFAALLRTGHRGRAWRVDSQGNAEKPGG